MIKKSAKQHTTSIHKTENRAEMEFPMPAHAWLSWLADNIAWPLVLVLGAWSLGECPGGLRFLLLVGSMAGSWLLQLTSLNFAH